MTQIHDIASKNLACDDILVCLLTCEERSKHIHYNKFAFVLSPVTAQPNLHARYYISLSLFLTVSESVVMAL